MSRRDRILVHEQHAELERRANELDRLQYALIELILEDVVDAREAEGEHADWALIDFPFRERAAVELGVSMDDVDTVLGALMAGGYVEPDFTEEGDVFTVMPTLFGAPSGWPGLASEEL